MLSHEAYENYADIHANILPLHDDFTGEIATLAADPSTNWGNVDYYGLIRDLPNFQRALEKLDMRREERSSKPLDKMQALYDISVQKMLFYPIGSYLTADIIDSLHANDPYTLAKGVLNVVPMLNQGSDDSSFTYELMTHVLFKQRVDVLMNSADTQGEIWRSMHNYIYRKVESGEFMYLSNLDLTSRIFAGLTQAATDMSGLIKQGLEWDDVRAWLMGAARQNLMVTGKGEMRDHVVNGRVSVGEASKLNKVVSSTVTLGCIALPKMKEMYEIVQGIDKAIKDSK